jgi:predicted transcriptional regulator
VLILGVRPASGGFEHVKIRDVMNTKAARIHLGQSMALAAETLVLTDAGDLMVIDDDDGFVGVLAGGDVLHAIMPDFEGLMEAGASLTRACEIFVGAGDDYADEPIDRLVIHGSITVSGDDELLKAATVMITMGIRLLAVVDDGRLMGTVSRADVCWGVLVEQPRRRAAASRG